MTALLGAFLRRLARDELGARAIVRGSQLTARWVPGRTAHDLDLLLEGAWTTDLADARLREVLAADDPAGPLDARSEVIWAESATPGVRLHVGFAGGPAGLQVDVAWGDPLAAPPRAIELAGVALRGVAPEVMFGWKAHGLVEHGRGRWSAKTLADVVLIPRHVALDAELARRAVELAFESRGLALAALDPFFDDPAWGTSRNSQRKWRSFQRRRAWAPGPLPEVIAEARSVLGRYVLRGLSRVAPAAH